MALRTLPQHKKLHRGDCLYVAGGSLVSGLEVSMMIKYNILDSKCGCLLFSCFPAFLVTWLISICHCFLNDRSFRKKIIVNGQFCLPGRGLSREGPIWWRGDINHTICKRSHWTRPVLTG